MLSSWLSLVCTPAFLWAWIGLAVVTAISLTRITAPYGRHGRPGWGPLVGARAAWFWMEISALIGFSLCIWVGGLRSPHALLIACVYGGHYVYRSLIYPLLTSSGAAPASVWVVVMAFVFNVINSSILGGWAFVVGPDTALDGVDILGLALVLAGFLSHVRADAMLRGLRQRLGPGYHIPHGGMYRFVSCPNYLGELIQWLGLALMMDALAGWSFFVWTAANLVPRAIKHHAWYRARFEDYPPHRKAILPGLL